MTLITRILGATPGDAAVWFGHRVMPSEPTVLLVDDEPTIVRGIAELLRRRGYDVLTAQNGGAAVEVAASRHVDVAVIDYHIPDWRGDVVLAALVAHQPHLARQTVFITGDIGDRVRNIASHTGCPLLFKPFDIEVLEGLLRHLLSDVEDRPSLGGAARRNGRS
jgi:CheY-like chemotaxis protein